MANNKLKIFDLSLIALFAAILFAQEQILTNIPGVQLSIFLIILFSKTLGLTKTVIIVIIYVLLDNFYMNSFSLQYTPVMFVGWLLIPLTICTIFKKIESPLILGLLSIVYAFIYCWLYIIPNYFLLGIGPIEYLISDILFEIILAICSFLTVFWLYKPCSRLINLLLVKKNK